MKRKQQGTWGYQDKRPRFNNSRGRGRGNASYSQYNFTAQHQQTQHQQPTIHQNKAQITQTQQYVQHVQPTTTTPQAELRTYSWQAPAVTQTTWGYTANAQQATTVPQQQTLVLKKEVEEPEEPYTEPKPIEPITPKPEHSAFWHRKIGSVFPVIPMTQYRTSLSADVPSEYLPAPPTTTVRLKFSPNPNMFHMKIRPRNVKRKDKDGKGLQPPAFVPVFGAPEQDTEKLLLMCKQWKKQKTMKCILARDAAKRAQKMESLCRDIALWYGQWCLVCERELSYKSIGPHFSGRIHKKQFTKNPIMVNYERVNPTFVPATSFERKEKNEEYAMPFPLYGVYKRSNQYNVGTFLKCMGLKKGDKKQRILICGDYDLTFTLGFNRTTQFKHEIVVAPFTLMKSHPFVQRNLATCKRFNITVNTDVKIQDPNSFTFDNQFDKVIFLFPQVSFLQNLADPLNSQFCETIFKNVNRNAIMKLTGHLYILLKKGQFVSWDLCTISFNCRLFLQRAVIHHSGAFHPFEPREEGDRTRKLIGTKAPVYYIFSRTKEEGLGERNPWVEQTIAETPAALMDGPIGPTLPDPTVGKVKKEQTDTSILQELDAVERSLHQPPSFSGGLGFAS